MRIRSAKNSLALAVVLLAALLAGACGGGDDKAGNANANRNAANVNTNATSNAGGGGNTGPTADSSQDNALRNTVEANLARAGVTGVTVSVSGGEVTLRGNIVRAKLQDAIQAAHDAKPKRVDNQLNIQ